MSDSRASSSAAFAQGAGDPIGNLIAAASDAWIAGLSAMQLMAEQAAAARAASGRSDPLSALTALSIGFSTAMADFVAAGAGQTAGLHSAPTSPAPAPGGFADGLDVSSPMVQALMVGMTSTLRYWRGLAGVYARHQGILMRAAALRTMAHSQGSKAEDRLLVDELRAFFREVGDVAMQEARRLESELEQVGEILAHRTDQSGASETYRRRWKAKD
jgi:hypothetical protein